MRIVFLTGKPVDEWISDYINEKAGDLEKQKIANPFSVIKSLIYGEPNFFNCDENENNLKIYPECKYAIFLEDIDNSPFEEVLKPEVKGVLKAGIKYLDNLRISVGDHKNFPVFNSWSNELSLKNKDNESENKELIQEILTSWKKYGRKDGLIDIKCNYLDWDFSWIGFKSLSSEQTKTCEALLQIIFSGGVHDKRWCLFELPEGKSYLSEYYYQPFYFSNWFNNNKFWAKCSSYGLNKPYRNLG